MLQFKESGKVLKYKLSGGLSFFNKTIEKLSVTDIFPNDFGNKLYTRSKDVFKNKKSTVFKDIIEINAEEYYYEIRIVYSKEGSVIAIMRDITEMKKAEAQLDLQREKLIQADKLGSLGTIVASVAHEINNPNNCIYLTCESLYEEIKCLTEAFNNYIDDSIEYNIGGYSIKELKIEIIESINRIIRNSGRIKKIIQELMSFAHKNIDSIKEGININKVIESAIELMQYQIKQYTKYFLVCYEEGLPDIKGNFQQLEQVFIDIIQNAGQSLTSNEKKIWVSTRCNKKNKKIIISIKDEGVGINSNVIKKVTKPFFTTKPEKYGTGLGLFVSSKIIKDHGGELCIYSEPGKGTTVKILLPYR